MKSKTLHQQLIKYHQEGYYPFHMPGHKRALALPSIEAVYQTDITEIDGFDNLHDAEGILKSAQEKAARVFKSQAAYFLINGSSSGLLAAISAVTNEGDQVLVARNSHKSVYHGLMMKGLEPIYLYPQTDDQLGINLDIKPELVDKHLKENVNIRAVIITSPTYEGIVSDIDAIARIVHKYQIPLIVDEAHGAHFGFYQRFPKSAISQGADIVVQSLHKTLPSLTQTAILHRNGHLVDVDKLRFYLSVYQTSSPSYILMSSIDDCVEYLDTQSEHDFEHYVQMLDEFRYTMNRLEYLKIYDKDDFIGIFDFDLSKILIGHREGSSVGHQIYDYCLKQHYLQMEMASLSYCLAMTSVSDQKIGFKRLEEALRALDQQMSGMTNGQKRGSFNKKINEPVCVMPLKQVVDCQKRLVALDQAKDQIAGDFINLYPPGVPLITPGELISSEFIEQIRVLQGQGFNVQGLMMDQGIMKIKIVE